MIDDPGMAAALAGGLGEVKAYLRIDGDLEDAVLQGLIAAAGDVAEGFVGQALIARGFAETMSASSEWRRLARLPVRGITAVEAVSVEGVASALPVDGYAIDIDADGDGWVRVLQPGAARVRISYEAGMAMDWASLPPAIRQGIVRLAAHLHAHRDAAEEGAPPMAVAALLRPWRRMQLA